MENHTYVVLMAGGAGTRFWPLSRRARPKQVLPIAGDRPMIRATRDRVGLLASDDRILVVTGKDQVGSLRAALPEVPEENFLCEPLPRNTAPCIGLAAVHALGRDPDAVLLCLPADHVIRPPEEFRATCEQALERADQGRTLVTFGITPRSPATGYGYILRGEQTAPGFARVAAFREKPPLEVAERYVAGGNHLWNSGMFAWRADVFLEETRIHMPANADRFEVLASEPDRLDEIFPEMDSESVDYGILEPTDRAEVMPVGYEWDDVGSFRALERLVAPDEAGNHSRGALLALESNGLLTVAPEGHLVAAFGVRDLVIVSTPDATLVCPRDRAEDVKRIVEALSEIGRDDLR